MISYFDSSALVAIYVPEESSPRVRREVRAAGQVPFTPLHDLEVQNALRVACGRGRLGSAELARCLEHLKGDLEASRLARTQIDLFRLFEQALELSRVYGVTILARSLDLLHVAAAVELGCKRLISGDDRQLALVKAAGLDPVDVKGRSKR